MRDIVIAPVAGPLGEAWAELTFPSYRPLLPLLGLGARDSDGRTPVAVTAVTDGAPVGLALARLPRADAPPPPGGGADDPAWGAAELLSVYVVPPRRGEGVATALLAALEAHLIAHGARRVAGVYMTGKPSIPVLERVLAKRGFSAPRLRMVAVRITPEEAERCDWYRKGRLPEGSELIAWASVTSGERAALRRSHDATGWIPRDLEPWRFEAGFDAASSVGLRRAGEIAGWVLTHRVSPDLIRFTDAYVHPDLHRRGALFPMLRASLERLRGTGAVCTFVTSAQFGRMLPFVQRRIAPFAHFFGETRGVWKDLAAPSVAVPSTSAAEPPDIIVNYQDRVAWNAFVASNPHGHVFQSWEWGELQQDVSGRPLRIVIDRDGRIAGCVQALLFEGASRTFAYVPRGPVSDPGDDGVTGALLDALVDQAGRAGATLVRVEPQWADDPELARRLERRGFAAVTQHIMPPRTLVVDLRPPVETLWAALRANTRNRIRLAAKLGVTIRVGQVDDMDAFVRLHAETNARHGLRPDRPEQFYAAARLFGAPDTMRLYLAEADGRLLAGITVFVWGTTATYLWGASSGSDEARRLNPNQALHWTAMQWARSRGCTAYDLFGIPDHDREVLEAEYGRRTDRWWNLYRFKRGFGGTVHRHLGTFDGTLAR